MYAELKYWYLHEHKLFRNLSHHEVNSLCMLKKFKKSKKSEIVELPQYDKQRIYFLKKGALKLIKITDEGEEVVLDILQKNDLFGELGFIDDTVTESQFIKVLTDEAIICTFDRDNLETLMLKKPDFALNYIKFIGFNFKKIQNSYNNIFFKDAKTRLLLFLQSLIHKEEKIDTTFILPNYLTQKDIAQLICTTRQTVIHLFNELEKEGILEYSQKQICISNIDALQKLCEKVK